MSFCSPRFVAALATLVASLVGTSTALAQQQAQQAPPARPEFYQANPPWGEALSDAQQVRLEQIVNYWSFSSDQITTFECKFSRLDYSAVWVEDPNIAYSMAEGVIRYASPDKGMYRVDDLKFYVPDTNPAEYEPRDGEVGEHWVCDGASIYEFKTQQQELLEMRLPPDMQGEAISDGPLPFLFGVEAEKLFDRYWIREITPAEGQQGVYWLEAYPKRQEDATNFDVAVIILDANDFLPSAMQLIMPGGKERKVFQFTDRKKNTIVGNLMQRWLNNFIKPELPRGWRYVVEDFGAVPAAGGQPPAGPGAPAQLPAVPGQETAEQGSTYQRTQRPILPVWREE